MLIASNNVWRHICFLLIEPDLCWATATSKLDSLLLLVTLVCSMIFCHVGSRNSYLSSQAQIKQMEPGEGVGGGEEGGSELCCEQNCHVRRLKITCGSCLRWKAVPMCEMLKGFRLPREPEAPPEGSRRPVHPRLRAHRQGHLLLQAVRTRVQKSVQHCEARQEKTPQCWWGFPCSYHFVTLQCMLLGPLMLMMTLSGESVVKIDGGADVGFGAEQSATENKWKHVDHSAVGLDTWAWNKWKHVNHNAVCTDIWGVLPVLCFQGSDSPWE